MAYGLFEPPHLGAHWHELPRGPRVRLRLIQIRDRRAIRAFLAERGVPSVEMEAARMAVADPRRRVAVCATALVGGAETMVGVGGIEVGAQQPDLLVVDPDLTDGLDELIAHALRRRAETIAERRAA